MNLLLTGAWGEAQARISALTALGHHVCFMQREDGPLPCEGAWVEGVVCNGLFLHHPLSEFPRLRYIQLTSAGLDRVDTEEIRRRGIALRNAAGVYSIPMAEFALAGVLQLYKQSRFFAENQKAHRWEKRRDLSELYGKTVSVIGCGSVGRECQKRFEAFGCPVREIHRDLRGFDGAMGADIVVVTMALTEETRGIIHPLRMKPGAVLVNIARGALVDEPELLQALGGDKPHLRGAVLDVFDDEPLPPEHPLWDCENVILTPHNSFVGEGNAARLREVIESGLVN